jgi:hypothetical protein
MTMPTHNGAQRVVEKYYSPRELFYLLGFSPEFWRDKCKAGELTLRTGAPARVVSEPVEIAGELRIPASAVNAFLGARRFFYDVGIKARNTGELRRKLAKERA